jgi:hypothetical protein
VVAALAAGQVSESVGRLICLWTSRLPEKLGRRRRTPGHPGSGHHPGVGGAGAGRHRQNHVCFTALDFSSLNCGYAIKVTFTAYPVPAHGLVGSAERPWLVGVEHADGGKDAPHARTRGPGTDRRALFGLGAQYGGVGLKGTSSAAVTFRNS